MEEWLWKFPEKCADEKRLERSVFIKGASRGGKEGL